MSVTYCIVGKKINIVGNAQWTICFQTDIVYAGRRKMIRIAVLEDEQKSLDTLLRCLDRYQKDSGEELDVKVFSHAMEFILCSFILSLLGLIEAFSGRYLIQGELLDAQDGMRYGILRCTATFGHPIAFGTFQAIVALMAFYRITTNISRQKKRRLIILCYSRRRAESYRQRARDIYRL